MGKKAQDFLACHFLVDVTDDDQGHIIGVIPALVEVHDTVPIEGLNRVPIADDRPSVGMLRIGDLKEFGYRPGRGRILTTLPLFHDDLAFFVQFVGIKRRVLDSIGQNFESSREMTGRQYDVVDGMIRCSKRIDIAA